MSLVCQARQLFLSWHFQIFPLANISHERFYQCSDGGGKNDHHHFTFILTLFTFSFYNLAQCNHSPSFHDLAQCNHSLSFHAPNKHSKSNHSLNKPVHPTTLHSSKIHSLFIMSLIAVPPLSLLIMM